MDFDPKRFSRDEFGAHAVDLGIIQGDDDLEKLLKRTTKNTRTGEEFNFKPAKLSIGTHTGEDFVEERSFPVDSEGPDPHHADETQASSFWIRFRENWFSIRAFCHGHEERALRPYETRIPFRNVTRITLTSEYPVDCGSEKRVKAQIYIRCRRPFPLHAYRLHRVVLVAGEPVYDRHATEADFFHHSFTQSEKEAGEICALWDKRLLVHPGLWTDHHLTLVITPRQYKLLWMCMVRLRLVDLNVSILAHAPLSPRLQEPDWSPLPILDGLEFNTRYLVEGLVTHGAVTIAEVADLLSTLLQYSPTLRLSLLEHMFYWDRRGTVAQDMREVAQRLSGLSLSQSLPQHLVSVRRCLVTPRRCILQPPAPETSNSVLRHFLEHRDRFLRVQFVDDDGNFPVTSETSIIDDFLEGAEGVYARIRRTLEFGLSIAGRSYVPLAFSESQAREHGYWMIAEDGDFTVANVLAWMGDLSEERIVAKHSARRSLPLSITRQLDLEVKIKYINDVSRVSQDGLTEYVFTDGVAVCHPSILTRYAHLIGYLGELSAVQGRIGGIKGVFCAADLETAARMSENEVWVRHSQEKFETPHRTLHVVKPASFSRATLNRQAVLLLEELGVPTDTLVNIFLDEKAKIDSEDPMRIFGGQYLSALCSFPVESAVRVDIHDTLLENILYATKCRLLSDLKWKARIEIPKSAFLMGVADETDSLNEGEIFCQISPLRASSEVIVGQCTIYRNPCLHPGDVRPVRAVDCPRLEHLKNVIVFSTRGERPLPNMLGGGDLDGDCYSLLWDPRLQVADENAFPPMNYTPPDPRRSPGEVTQEQVKQHYIDMIKTDALGRICNAHLARADKYGARDAECLELASMASLAVDFPKTGVPVDQYRLPKVEEYPDFMGKGYKSIRLFKKQEIKSYASKKALGQMFKSIDPEPEFKEVDIIAGDPNLCGLSIPKQYERYLRDAALFKARYDFQLVGLLRRYNICEAECVAGFLLRSPKTRFKAEKDYDLRANLREAFQLVVKSTVSQVKEHLKSEAVTDDPNHDLHAWALAAYQVTYRADFAEYLDVDLSRLGLETTENEVEELLNEIVEEGFEDKKYLSFAWLFPEELVHLKTRDSVFGP